MNISVFVDGANFSTCRAESRLRDGDMIAQHEAEGGTLGEPPNH